MIRRITSGSNVRFARATVVLGAVVLLLWSVAPASAQLSRVGISIGGFAPGGIVRGTDIAYDPVNGVYLLVADQGGNGPVFGVFVNTAGTIVSPIFAILNDGTGSGTFPRAAYSPDVSNGAGGVGGFLVTWNHIFNGNLVSGRLVSYNASGYLVSGIARLDDGQQGGSWAESGPAMAYSRTSRRFLVAWRTMLAGIRGRFVDTNGNPFGGVLPLENAGGAQEPALAWNPATDDFGLVNTGWGGSGAFAQFRRVRAADGLIQSKSTFGFGGGTFATGIAVNPSTNQYVLVWVPGQGTNSATFDQFGNQLGTTFVTGRLGMSQALALALGPVSGTFLVVSQDFQSYDIGGVELTGSGLPIGVAQVLTNGGSPAGSYYPRTTARAGTNHWGVVYSRQFREGAIQVVATSSTGGGPSGPLPPPPTAPPPTSGGCTTPDPFASLGGGTCVNGGWLPPSSPPPPPPPTAPPPPPPPTSSCTTPDPFASLGGGTCVNGGWLPPGFGGAPAPAPTAPPPPPPPASTCSTPDPFVSIGGGTCVNGGWVPGSAASGGCTTPDPFASIGGGTCVSGGWVPRTGSSTGTCSTPDPFVSIGGGTCVSGGWIPRVNSCTTPDPFVSLGGGICINGGWIPR